jgi:hypothetical protein
MAVFNKWSRTTLIPIAISPEPPATSTQRPNRRPMERPRAAPAAERSSVTPPIIVSTRVAGRRSAGSEIPTASASRLVATDSIRSGRNPALPGPRSSGCAEASQIILPPTAQRNTSAIQ